MQNRFKNLSLPENTKINLTKYEQVILEDIEDNFIKPPLSYPVWAYDREEQFIYIYNSKKFNAVIKKYYDDKFNIEL